MNLKYVVIANPEGHIKTERPMAGAVGGISIGPGVTPAQIATDLLRVTQGAGLTELQRLLWTCGQSSGLSELEAGRGDEVEISESASVALIVLHQPPEPCRPGKGPLDHPAPRQQQEAALGVRQLHHLQFDAMRPGGLTGPLAGVALVDIGQFDALPGGDLYSLRQAADFGAVIHAGRRDGSASKWLSGSTAKRSFEPFLRLAPSEPARSPLSGEERKVRLSRMAALGCAVRPAARRNTARRSSASASKQPAANQRCACW